MNTVSKQDFENTCKLFIAAIHKYFNHLSKVSPTAIAPSETGVPYVKEPGDLVLKEFTGMIGISGNRKGIVYFSGQREIFEDLLKVFTKLDEITDERVLDMAGAFAPGLRWPTPVWPGTTDTYRPDLRK